MADIGVVHGPIDAGGGAEAVAAHTLAALTNDGHDVTLYTTDDFNQTHLERRYEATIDPAPAVEQIRTLSAHAVNLAAVGATPLGVTDFPLLRQIALERVVDRRYQSRHDLLICTHGEFSVDGAIEYIHFPYFSATAMRRFDTRFDERLYPMYHRLCRRLKRRDRTAKTTTVTNSQWTANVVAETLGRKATVVYPPVDTESFDPPPWGRMEDGFVTVGRLHPLKRQHTLIDVVEAVRERGFETHLHIVGPVGSQKYYERLRKRADARSFVHLDGELDRDELVELLETHRYGIHGRPFEHFGIAVAELVAAGSIPFVPASGGQQEIVRHESTLCYTDPTDAVEKITTVLATLEQQSSLRSTLDESTDQFSRDRFQTTMRQLIREQLNRA